MDGNIQERYESNTDDQGNVLNPTAYDLDGNLSFTLENTYANNNLESSVFIDSVQSLIDKDKIRDYWIVLSATR